MAGFTDDAFTDDAFVLLGSLPFRFKYNSSKTGISFTDVQFEESETNVNIKLR